LPIPIPIQVVMHDLANAFAGDFLGAVLQAAPLPLRLYTISADTFGSREGRGEGAELEASLLETPSAPTIVLIAGES